MCPLNRGKIIVGLGSVGSIIAEALARMGVAQIKLIDFDTIEYRNLDRTLHACEDDVKNKKTKVKIAAEAIQKSATAKRFYVEPIEGSIVEESGFREALDCDILFSCVDRPWPRSVLNYIAYAHLIPVIDGGILIKTNSNGSLRSADWKAHIVGPGRKCLECIGQFDPGLVSAEREGYLDNPTYIENLPNGHLIKRNENVFAFSLSTASFQLLQMLSMIVGPSGITNIGAQNYHFVIGAIDKDYDKCKETCLYPSLVARGDSAGIFVTGRHLKQRYQEKEDH